MDRRSFLAGFGALGIYGTAGCLTGDTEETAGGSIRPETEPETVSSPLSCDDTEAERVSRMSQEEDINWGDTDNFALRIDQLSFNYGDEANITLTNTSSETKETGSEYKFNFEYRTETGWQDVRVWKEGAALPIPAIAVSHEPNNGFSWEIDLTEEGIVEASSFDSDEIQVCPNLNSGRYRFTFWGVSEENGIAVAFTLNRDA